MCISFFSLLFHEKSGRTDSHWNESSDSDVFQMTYSKWKAVFDRVEKNHFDIFDFWSQFKLIR